MGAENSKEECLPDPLTGPVQLMAERWGRDIVDQVQLWHKVSDFHMKGILSEAKLVDCRDKLEDFDRDPLSRPPHSTTLFNPDQT